jgi:cell division protein FtsI (penicillin-binding protein 3)
MAAPSTGRRRPAGRRGGGLFGSPRPARNGVDGRIRLLRFVFIVFLVLVGGKAVALASSSQHLTRIAQDQQTADVVLPAHRGSILDRNGNELAVGKPQQTVFADPHLLNDPTAAADELCDALQINRRKARRAVEDKLVAGKQQKSWFTYVARKVDPELAKAALALDLPGVVSYTEEKRMYPLKATAAQVLGFAGTENKGLAGIELLYDEDLSGRAGSETVVRDPAGHALKTVAHQEPKSGQNVRLTLDSQIQYYAEDVLRKTVRDTGGTSATSIVMDPRTGEILAMANVTKEGFHGFGKGDQSAEKNRAVTDVYEPGSIFKLVTISGALADGTVTPDQKFTLPPSIHVADREINESHPRGTVTYSVREILQWSSNVGAVTIGMRMKKDGLARWIKAFGFGKPTGIRFPGEAGGIVAPVDQWSDSSIGNIPMGQGIAVTPIQMAAAFSAVANNGWAVRPRLVAQVGDAVYDQVVDRHRVVPGKVAREVRSMLALAVAEGTGTEAQIPGYDVAGKTGTAEMAVPGGYAKGVYVASFIGMVPADHPKLVVLCAVNGTPEFGGQAAAPAVKKIMQYSLQRLEIAP